MLERLERLAPADVDVVPSAAVQPRIRRYTRRLASRSPAASTRARGDARAATLLLVLAIGLAAGVLRDDRALVGRVAVEFVPVAGPLGPGAAASRAVPDPLPVPSASEVSLARARAWSGNGRLRDALAALEAIRPGDPLRAQADDLRARIQQQLLDSARATQRAAVP